MIKKGITPQLAEVGKIKIGGKGETRKSKKGEDYQLPIKFNHFVVTTTEKGKDGNFIHDQNIMKQLGNEPKEISIVFPFDDPHMNFFTQFQYYHGKKCVCKGDGEKATRPGQDGISRQIDCDTETCEFLTSEPAKCKPSGILSCHLATSNDVGGIYKFRTHSWNSVSSIMGALEYFHNNTKGVLQGLPFKLKFLKKATVDHGNVNIVTVVMDGVELMDLRQKALDEFTKRTEIGLDMLKIENKARDAGFNIDTDDPADVDDEYYSTTTIDAETVEPDNRDVSERTADALDTAIGAGISVEQSKDGPEQAKGPFKFPDGEPDDVI